MYTISLRSVRVTTKVVRERPFGVSGKIFPGQKNREKPGNFGKFGKLFLGQFSLNFQALF